MTFHLRALRHIRSSLTTDMATSIAVALVQSRIDYANSLPYRLSTRNILPEYHRPSYPTAVIYPFHPRPHEPALLAPNTGPD